MGLRSILHVCIFNFELYVDVIEYEAFWKLLNITKNKKEEKEKKPGKETMGKVKKGEKKWMIMQRALCV